MRLSPFICLFVLVGACSQTYPKKVVKQSDSGQIILTYYENEMGEKTGMESTFYENGAPKAVSFFLDGLKQNTSTTYYSNGQIASEIEYNKDKPVGKAYYYSWNGNLKRDEVYSDDSELIRFKSYYFNGRLKEDAALRVSTKSVVYSKFYNLNEYHKVIHQKSNFAKIIPLSGTKFELELIHPEYSHFDSIKVYSTEDYRGDTSKPLITKRELTFFKHPLILEMKEGDSHYEYVNYLVLAYPIKIKKPIEYILYWHKSEPIPYDNIRPIF